MTGNLDLLHYNLWLLANGIYEPLCSAFPVWYAQAVLIMDGGIFAPYLLIGVFLAFTWRRFGRLEGMGTLIRQYGMFILWCGATHPTGNLAELGGFILLDAIVNAVTLVLSAVALRSTWRLWPKVRTQLQYLDDLLEKLAD